MNGTEIACDTVDALIEAIAAGELPDRAVGAHLASCPRCQAALARASAIERLLAAQPTPRVPAGFAAAVTARIRRERWRAEQALDLAFNLVVSLAVAVGLGGLYVILAASGVSAVSADLAALAREAMVLAASRIAPMLHVWAIASVLLASTLGLWWWTESADE